MPLKTEAEPAEGSPRRRRGRPELPPERRRTISLEIRLSPDELSLLTERAQRVPMGVTTFIRTAALGRVIKTPLPAAAFDCASALTSIGASLAKAVAEVDAGRPIAIDRADLHSLRDLVEHAGLATLGIRKTAP